MYHVSVTVTAMHAYTTLVCWGDRLDPGRRRVSYAGSVRSRGKFLWLCDCLVFQLSHPYFPVTTLVLCSPFYVNKFGLRPFNRFVIKRKLKTFHRKVPVIYRTCNISYVWA
jgi:hypothetical protein